MTFIKRVVGLPGETVQAVAGRVLICRAPRVACRVLSEPYARSFTDDFGPVTVPRNAYFVLGDNRVSSEDSRIWGTLPTHNVIGTAFVRYWPPQPIRHPLRMGWLRSRSSVQLALTVLLALALAYGVQRYVVGIFRVPSDSMARTLLPGDRLLAARFWYSIERPTRGDIVVLHPNGRGDRVFYADTASRRVFVKRIIGLPGDWVKARHGRVSICTGPGGTGCVPLDEPYVRGTTQQFGPIAVPTGRYFVMGDNRSDSQDSRIWGPVPRSQLLGRAFGLAWPPLRIRFF